MTTHPYRGRPPFTYWSSGVADVAPGEFDPVVASGFSIAPSDQVATLGSCFAQHLARRIRAAGYSYLIAEKAPPGCTADQAQTYDLFSARYGNVYTVRQAVQLLDRAFEGREFAEDVWPVDGRFADAFRPNVEPGGFTSETALREDRSAHLEAVRRVFLEADVIVFTLGLTEAWVSNVDGAVFPLAPGVAAGNFDPERHSFVNFDYPEVRTDLETWISRVNELRPGIRILLTVSPVPLAATFEDRHVWASTTYSKATLLAAARDVARTSYSVDYFPSYEVITNPTAEGRYFDDDLRSVRDLGVDHVMRLFQRHYFSHEAETSPTPVHDDEASARKVASQGRVSEVLCDEELLDPNLK